MRIRKSKKILKRLSHEIPFLLPEGRIFRDIQGASGRHKV